MRKWHEDNLLGPGRKMHSDKDRWNEVVASKNLMELRAEPGGSRGRGEHANLLVFLGLEAVELRAMGGEEAKAALSSLTFLLHPEVGIDFPPVTAPNENFCVAAKAGAGRVPYLFKYDYLHFMVSRLKS